MIRSVALAHDGLARAKFDAVDFFARATCREIIGLAKSRWRGAAAESAARSILEGEDDESLFPDLRAVFVHLRENPSVGVWVAMHGPDALRWVRDHRIDIAGGIEDAMGDGASHEEACDPTWDRDPHWAGDYERPDDERVCAAVPSA